MSPSISSPLLRLPVWHSVPSLHGAPLLDRLSLAYTGGFNTSTMEACALNFRQTYLSSAAPTPTTPSRYCAIPLQVTPGAGNVYGTLMGGVTGSLIDIATSYHLSVSDFPEVTRSHVSSSLGIKYVGSAKVGTNLVIVSQFDKGGKRLAYTSATIYKDPSEEELSRIVEDLGGTPTSSFGFTEAELEQVLSRLKIVATGSHTKAYIPLSPAMKKALESSSAPPSSG